MQKNIVTTLSCMASLLFNPASANVEAGDWEASMHRGTVFMGVENGPGNSFGFICDTSRSEEPVKDIYITIRDKPAPPNEAVRFFVDGIEIAIPTLDNDNLEGSLTFEFGSKATVYQFDDLWKRARKGGQIIVALSDGRSSYFSLNGANEMLPEKVCGDNELILKLF